jgi:Tfp pilus assembly protein PilZ
METASSMLAISIGMGGAVFVGFVLFWFVRIYFKKRKAAGPAASVPPPTLLRAASWEEKRSQPRLAVSWRATFAGHRGDSPAQIKDISLGGAFVVCAHPLPLSKRFLITMDLPGRGPLELKAEVVWSNTHVPADRVINRGMGIRFVDNSEEKRKMLSEAVAAALRSPAAA